MAKAPKQWAFRERKHLTPGKNGSMLKRDRSNRGGLSTERKSVGGTQHDKCKNAVHPIIMEATRYGKKREEHQLKMSMVIYNGGLERNLKPYLISLIAYFCSKHR